METTLKLNQTIQSIKTKLICANSILYFNNIGATNKYLIRCYIKLAINIFKTI